MKIENAQEFMDSWCVVMCMCMYLHHHLLICRTRREHLCAGGKSEKSIKTWMKHNLMLCCLLIKSHIYSFCDVLFQLKINCKTCWKIDNSAPSILFHWQQDRDRENNKTRSIHSLYICWIGFQRRRWRMLRDFVLCFCYTFSPNGKEKMA
jgi:hypothetical protein